MTLFLSPKSHHVQVQEIPGNLRMNMSYIDCIYNDIVDVYNGKTTHVKFAEAIHTYLSP